MTGELVLLTGSTGFIGSAVLKKLLEAGYIVRLAVRSIAKAESYTKSKYPEASITFIEVPDITVDGAFDEAVKDVVYIEHVASPFTYKIEDPEKDLLIPAVKGTKGILYSALKYGDKVKRIVVTSSCAAVYDGHDYDLRNKSPPMSEADWNPVTWQEGLDGPTGVSYCASKTFAEKAVWEFVENEKPNFSVTVLNPPFVFGPMLQNVTKDNVNTSNAIIANLMATGVNSAPTMLFGMVDVRDLADAHVKSLTAPGVANQRIIVSGRLFTYGSLLECAKKTKEEGDAYCNGPDDSAVINKEAEECHGIDYSKSVKLLDMKYLPFKTTISETAKQLVSLGF
ncbi:uncharacterized protein V1516DRAFT_444594 [Lipomyces oligophaga]|uniref:uncharacterized protein n=1 Tax=Lipomyces oligophaga TaxID=45792 RepID=UPI0034CD6E2B